MDFKLVETQTTNEYDECFSSDEETYDDIQQCKRDPVVRSVDKKRMNKTVQCPKCKKFMNKKTLTYSHNCQNSATPKRNIPKETSQKETPQITDEHIYDYLVKQEHDMISQKRKIKQDRFNTLLTRAF